MLPNLETKMSEKTTYKCKIKIGYDQLSKILCLSNEIELVSVKSDNDRECIELKLISNNKMFGFDYCGALSTKMLSEVSDVWGNF